MASAGRFQRSCASTETVGLAIAEHMDIQDAESCLIGILGETATKELMARGAKLSLVRVLELARSAETSIGLS